MTQLQLQPHAAPISATDYLKHLGIVSHDEFWPLRYPVARGTVYVYNDGRIAVYSTRGNGSLYTSAATSKGLLAMCELLDVELPPAPDEIHDEFSAGLLGHVGHTDEF